MVEKTARKVIGRLMEASEEKGDNDHFRIEQWEWPQGVAMYSLYKYYKHTRDPVYFAAIVDWYEKHLKKGLPDKNVNTVAPLLGLIHLYEETKEEKYLEVCKRWARWIMEDMPRTEESGLQHITSDTINEQQIWDDTLFMTVLFLAKMGKLLDQKGYIEEAVRQFLLHIKYLHDPHSGLWFHGWTFKERNHFGEILWARGNCWFTISVVEFIEILDLDGGLRDYLLTTLETQVKALEKLQHESGMWHTVLNDPTSYVETSAAAGFAYGILKAVRKQYIDPAYAEMGQRAAKAVLEKIREDGIVEQVSYGTAMGNDADHYKNIPICPTAYGQGLTFLLLTEVIYWEDKIV